MLKRNHHTNIWCVDLAASTSFVESFLKTLDHYEIGVNFFDLKSEEEIGIILVNGNKYYEQLISLLNIQLKSRSNRIIVLNTSREHFNKDEVMKIFSYGAEYLFENSSLNNDFECIVEKIGRWRNIESVLKSPIVRKSIIGESSALKKILRSVVEVGLYSTASVLILGERGTGKELIARLIHDLTASKNPGTLSIVDCTTIKPELSGSEFFGHEKGSYTGADHTREGAFALANNGTLFLDEVGEMPLQMQAELLRVVQEGTYKKIGSNIWRQANFRLVCATNRNLEKETETGNFRKDLYDRISLWTYNMPTLDERKEEIPSLIKFFFKKNFPETLPVIDDAVVNYLTERSYPGNIRELQNLVKRICLRYVGKGPITLGDIPDYDRQGYDIIENKWYENSGLTESIISALNAGYDAKNIVDTVKSLTTKIALSMAGSNKEVSQLLRKSERWIQLQKAKGK